MNENSIIKELEENSKEIVNYLSIVQSFIDAGEIEYAYKLWETVLSPLLLFNNKYQEVSLMVISGMEHTEDFAYTTRESDVLTPSGQIEAISKDKNEINMLFKNNSIQLYLSKHLHEMLNSVKTEQIFVDKSQDPTKAYYNNTEYILKEYIKSKKSRQRRYSQFFKTDKEFLTFKQLMYGESETWYGNVADAFVQHLAHMHSQIFLGNINNDFNYINNKSVFKEEGSYIMQLLADSRNNIPWYTGGDLILKLQHGVILNIQLKTTQNLIDFSSNKKQIVGDISANKLKEFLRKLELIFSKESINIEKLSNILFEELRTSAWIEGVNKQIKKGTSELIKN